MASFLTITFFGGLGMFVFALLMTGLFSLMKESKTVPVLLAVFSILLAFGSIFAYRNVPEAQKGKKNAAETKAGVIAGGAAAGDINSEAEIADTEPEPSVGGEDDFAETGSDDGTDQSMPEAVSDPNETTIPAAGSSDNSDSDNNTDQQNISAQYVLNTNTKEIHLPDCDEVPKIAPENYAGSNDGIDDLIEQGYSPCGHCKPDEIF